MFPILEIRFQYFMNDTLFMVSSVGDIIQNANEKVGGNSLG